MLVLPEATGEPSGPVDPPGDAGGDDAVNSALPALVNFFVTSTQTLYTEFTTWIQTRDLFTYAAVAVFAILLVLITRNQTPNSALKPMLDTARAISTDLVAALEREAERRYELAKGTPQGYDDAFYQFLMTVMRDVRTKMDEQPPSTPAPPEDAEG
ncbi:MAG: hypothetical protein IPM16_06720 [Chloroflexi bacterium]|nr:hypothetical protein [Chloroflexota bacterium]